jgi:hypothetical protein
VSCKFEARPRQDAFSSLFSFRTRRAGKLTNDAQDGMVHHKGSKGPALTNLLGVVKAPNAVFAPPAQTALFSSTFQAYIRDAGASRIWR